MPASQPASPNYLLFSDVHLGGDLVQHARPHTAGRLERELQVDRDLAGLLDHYREHPEEEPWTLIIAGDLVDLIGMSISAEEEAALETPLTDEERAHGLGSSADHAALKMRAVVKRHGLVFAKLAEFVAAGHNLVFVRGNHDVEFYWDPVRKVFIDALVERSGLLHDAEALEAFRQRIEFRHWFYYVDGLLYVEHGHQYDEACCYPRLLQPLSPRDPRRLALSFSDILVRWVVRPTPGLNQDGHEHTNLWFYLRLAFSMGVGGCVRLGLRFFRAVLELLRVWRAHLSDRARDLRAEHDRQVEKLAARLHINTDKVRALASHWARPVTRGVVPILRSVFLDLLLVTGAVAALLLIVGVSGVLDPIYMPLLAMVAGGGVYAWLRRPRHFDPADALKAGANRVIDHLPARFVVMGHTHVPRMEALGDASTYVNLGGWAVDDIDLPGEIAPPQASNTHLVIRQIEGAPVAELRRWDGDRGAVLMEGGFGAEESGVHLRPAGAEERVA